MTGIVQNVNTHEFLIGYNKDEKLIHIYFNKIKPSIIEVKDVTGRTIISESVTGDSEAIVNVGFLSAGINTVNISGRDKKFPGRKYRELLLKNETAGRHKIELDASEIPAGFYMLQMVAGDVKRIASLQVVH